MRRDLVAVLLVGVTCACGGPPRHDGPPTYEDYAVSTYGGAAAPLQVTGVAADAWRATLTPLLAAGPTFAGGLAVGVSSCGEGCIMAAFVDLRTGKIYRDRAFIPSCFTYDFRPSSTLMIAHPVELPPGTVRGDCPDVIRYFRWTGDSLSLLLEVPANS